MDQGAKAKRLATLRRATTLMHHDHGRLATEARTSPHADIRRLCKAAAKVAAHDIQTLIDLANELEVS